MTKPGVQLNRSTIKTRRFFRSIRLETDFNDINLLEGYTLTPQVRQILTRITEAGLLNNSAERAWTITGPYGSGKSAFSLFLAHLSKNANTKMSLPWSMLESQDPYFAGHLFKSFNGKGLLPIVFTLRRAPLAQMILEGLIRTVRNYKKNKRMQLLRLELQSDLQNKHFDSQTVIKRLSTIADIVGSSDKVQGLILILDELGKALEYIARHSNEDIYLLQELAEFASRSGNRPVILISVLHQAFEQYGEYLNLTARKEWAKVQGRFSDIAFFEPAEQQMRLSVQALTALELNATDAEKNEAAVIAQRLIDVGYTPSTLKSNEFVSLSAAAYPLHPTVLISLPYLFRRFAQNERSLYAYLLSQEPYGLKNLLSNNGRSYIRLPDLYDYFMANLGGSIIRQSFARRWVEIAEVLERSPDLNQMEILVLKTIGLLGILGEISAFKATKEYISLTLADVTEDNSIYDGLSSLLTKSLIVFRRYNQTYNIWEGSDVDIETRLDIGRVKTENDSLSETLHRYLSARPLVARRHSHETGALRFFEIRYLDSPVEEIDLASKEGADGLILCCLPNSLSQAQNFLEWAQSDRIVTNNVLIVLPQQIGALREAAAELRAIHWVWQNTPELRDDRVARRELAALTAMVEQSINDAIQHLLDPKPEPKGSGALWLYQGQKELMVTPKDVSKLLSQVMDQVYPHSPRIKNELINRRTLSSAAAAARRNLIERMLASPQEELLGMSGFPPERSMYESVLSSSHLHRKEKDTWAFGPPQQNNTHNLSPIWQEMHRIIFGSITEPYPVNQLFDHLSSPPFGVMPGVLPVLLVSFILTYPDEISLYKESVFIPELGMADLEVLMRRPELFSISGTIIEGERKIVVQRIAERMKIKPATLPVVRALIRAVKNLPDHAWRTRQLPKSVLAVRDVFRQARSPERLLFYDLPKALSVEVFKAEEVQISKERINDFFDRLNEALHLLDTVTQKRIFEARNILLKSCGLPAGDSGWSQLRVQALQIEGKPIQKDLIPFIKRLNATADEELILDSVLALVSGRPPRSWTDDDIEHFPSQAKQVGKNFINAAHILGVLTPEEESFSKELTACLKKQLCDAAPPHVIRTVLARLLQDI